MNCQTCNRRCKKCGKHRNGLQRFRCAPCGKTYTEDHARLFAPMIVPEEKALLAIQLLIEGTSVRTVGEERIRGSVVTFSDHVGRNQLCLSINRHEHPSIAKLFRAAHCSRCQSSVARWPQGSLQRMKLAVPPGRARVEATPRLQRQFSQGPLPLLQQPC